MPSWTPSNQNSDALVKQYQESWFREFRRLKAKWMKASEEKRREYIMSVFDRITQLAKEDPITAALEFVKWLRSPHGALAWPYLWKREYAPTMVDITYYALQMVNRAIIFQMIAAMAR